MIIIIKMSELGEEDTPFQSLEQQIKKEKSGVYLQEETKEPPTMFQSLAATNEKEVKLDNFKSLAEYNFSPGNQNASMKTWTPKPKSSQKPKALF